MAFTNIFTTDKDGNPVIIEAETETGTTHFQLPPMTEEENKNYWDKVLNAMTDRLKEEMEENADDNETD